MDKSQRIALLKEWFDKYKFEFVCISIPWQPYDFYPHYDRMYKQMTERMNFNPVTTSAGPLVLDNGDYTFEFIDAQVFDRESTNQQSGETKQVYGVAVRAKIIVGNENLGKTVYLQYFYHTEGMQGMMKQFLMAAYGFNRKEEEKFNSFLVDNNISWDNDWEAKTVAPIWSGIVGRTASASVVKKPNPNNPEQINNNFGWRPADA